MEHFKAPVSSIGPVARDYYEMSFQWPHHVPVPAPGQFVTFRISDRSVPLLRRPFALSGFDPESGMAAIIFQRRGKGTEILSSYRAGDSLDVIGPLGRGFQHQGSGSGPVICVAGGIGLGPVLFLCRQLLSSERPPMFVFGARSADLVPASGFFRPLSPVICTDDGSLGFKGTVGDYLQSLDPDPAPSAVYCCGPNPMMKAVFGFAASKGAPCQVSMEQAMACGVGACMGCAVKRSGQDAYFRVCTEGPVFDAKDLEWT